LLKSTVDVVGEQAAEARSRLQKSLAQARDRLADDLESITDHGRDAISAADDFVHTRPWPVIGLAALAAVTAGFLLSRR
jgi:ElaB protein